VTLRGKRYDIEDQVTTVAELQERVKDVSGVSSEHSVLFGDKRLKSGDILSDVGVEDGAQLSMVPSSTKTSSGGGSKSKKGKKATTTTTTSTSAPSASAGGAAASVGDPSASVGAATDAMRDYLKEQGIDPDKLDEMMKGVGTPDGAGGNGATSMKESMEMMGNMLNSPIFQEYMNDPEKLEQSRQMILNNPMLKSMMAEMPGMEELLNSPEAWRAAMQAAAELYKDMDQNELMNAMMGGAGGLPQGAGGAGGLFDGTLDQSTTAAALDELDEDD